MIETEDKKTRLVCDRADCDAATEFYPSGQFKAMIADAREAGWVVYKRKGEGPFKHYCDWMHGD